MYDFFVNLLTPIMWGEAWVMTAWHKLFTILGIPETSGWGWALSIVGLTAVVRFLMIPLFVKQIQSSRKMQLIQPEMQKIQAKYKDKKDPESRQKMTQETMDLYKRTGSNPFSSCLPILLQSPFFFALFQLLNNLPNIAKGTHAPVGPITPDVASVIEKSTLFGAQLSSTFVSSSDINVKILTAVLIVLMSITTFTTQRQLMRKNMPAAALDNPFMKQQKVILYLMPIFFAISGINFPIGVLLYWLTTNAWSMGQQFYVIRRMPAPGSEAERAYEERQARRGKAIKKLHVPGLGDTSEPVADVQDTVVDAGKVSGQRQQPKGKKRQKKAPTAAVAQNLQDSPDTRNGVTAKPVTSATSVTPATPATPTKPKRSAKAPPRVEPSNGSTVAPASPAAADDGFVTDALAEDAFSMNGTAAESASVDAASVEAASVDAASDALADPTPAPSNGSQNGSPKTPVNGNGRTPAGRRPTRGGAKARTSRPDSARS